MRFVDILTSPLEKRLFFPKDLEVPSKQGGYFEESKNDFFVVKEEFKVDKIVLYDERTNINLSVKPNEKEIQLLKNKAIRMLKDEDIAVGYYSMTENFLNDILKKDVYVLKEVTNLIYKSVFDEVEILQKFIEVMSNLDYKLLHPTNMILALGCINHINVGVQEASIAAFEKWDDKDNLKVLKNINYTTDWIKDYAEEVIEYLESC